ncbi:MAG: hypothetical protein V3V99_02565 [candidate division Zixibacteria bacterium]
MVGLVWLSDELFWVIYGGAHCPSELSILLDLPLHYVDQLVKDMVAEGILERFDEKLPHGIQYRENQKPVRIAKSSPIEYIGLLAG